MPRRAATSSNPEVIDLLVGVGVPLDAQAENGTPLALASHAAKLQNMLRLLK